MSTKGHLEACAVKWARFMSRQQKRRPIPNIYNSAWHCWARKCFPKCKSKQATPPARDSLLKSQWHWPSHQVKSRVRANMESPLSRPKASKTAVFGFTKIWVTCGLPGCFGIDNWTIERSELQANQQIEGGLHQCRILSLPTALCFEWHKHVYSDSETVSKWWGNI